MEKASPAPESGPLSIPEMQEPEPLDAETQRRKAAALVKTSAAAGKPDVQPLADLALPFIPPPSP